MTQAHKRAEAVVIGASAGGVEALLAILPALPAAYPLPVVAVMHLPPDKDSLLPALFSARCALGVCEAEDKQPLHPGTLTFAPPDYHVLVEKDRTLSLSNEDPVVFSRPSIDVLFESAADTYGAGLIGVVLTGASHDGAEGLHAVIRAGGTGLVQHPGGASVPTMPQAALDTCPDALALSLEGIADFLKQAGEGAQ